jgi:hypothetical protein
VLHLDLVAMADGRLRGYRLVETELSTEAAPGQRPEYLWHRAIVRDLESGQDWAVAYREHTATGRRDLHQQPRRVHSEITYFRRWVED